MFTLGWTALASTLLGAVSWLGASADRANAGVGTPSTQDVRSYGLDVGLVRIGVTARTPAGALVHDLRPEQFRVFEDGVEQEVVRFGHDDAPISVVVLFDKSASMSAEKLMHAKDAVVNFVRAFRPQDEVLIVAFSDGIDILGDFGLDARTIERATKEIRVESRTRLYDATIEGALVIAAAERKEKRALLVLSDGEDTASAATLDDAVEAVRRAGVPVYAIGIEMDDDDRDLQHDSLWRRAVGANPPLDPLWRRPGQVSSRPKQRQPSTAIEALKRLSDGTGGWTYPIKAAKRCRELCIRVAQELRHQYLLGYQPTSAAGGGWRTVEVRTSRPGVVLSSRSGYYAGRP